LEGYHLCYHAIEIFPLPFAFPVLELMLHQAMAHAVKRRADLRDIGRRSSRFYRLRGLLHFNAPATVPVA
jgi:hypothetical protein